MSAPTTVPEVLLRAAEVIEERGWCQGTFSDKGGGVCVRGALYVAIMGTPWPSDIPDGPEWWLADEAAHVLDRRLAWSIERWNDQMGRTAEEVVAALRAAAGEVALSNRA